METDLFKLKMQIANLELHNAIMEDALLEAIDFINKYSDVVDADGTFAPNLAMTIEQKCHAAIKNVSPWDL